MGNYIFEAPKYVNFNNSRPLLVIGPRDRAIERAILTLISPHLSSSIAFPNTYARVRHGDEKPKSLQELASSIAKLRGDVPFVFETDITKFFPSINHKQLLRRLKAILPDQTLDELLLQIVRRRPQDLDEVPSDQQWYFQNVDRSVPQGSCLSPVLSYIYLIPFDRYLETRRVAYKRYVDDLVVFTDSAEEALAIEDLIHRRLGRLGLTAHKSYIDGDKKGHILSPMDAMSFVGFDFPPSGEIRPQSKAIERFKSRVNEICENATSLRELLNQLHNFSTGWLAAYAGCTLPTTLRKALDEHQLTAVRRWLKPRKVLSRSYHDVPKRSQAKDLGIILVNLRHEEPGSFDDGIDDFLNELTVEDIK